MKHYNKCLKLYQSKGQQAVFDYALKHKDIKWSYCEPCEIDSPIEDGACLVCGSQIES